MSPRRKYSLLKAVGQYRPLKVVRRTYRQALHTNNRPPYIVLSSSLVAITVDPQVRPPRVYSIYMINTARTIANRNSHSDLELYNNKVICKASRTNRRVATNLRMIYLWMLSSLEDGSSSKYHSSLHPALHLALRQEVAASRLRLVSNRISLRY